MPTYSYRCPKCGNEFDKFQKISDPPRARCPRCRATARRVITGGGGFLLKGEGFHATDYRSESYRQAAKAESGETGAGAGVKSQAKAESRAVAGAKEAKAESKAGPHAGTGKGHKAAGPKAGPAEDSPSGVGGESD